MTHEYRVTFGQQYAQDPHPRWPWAHPDGWVTVVAPNYEAARAAAFGMLGRFWAFIYGPGADEEIADVDWATLFPRGELGRVHAPAGK